MRALLRLRLRARRRRSEHRDSGECESARFHPVRLHYFAWSPGAAVTAGELMR